MKIYLIELRKARSGTASQYFNSLMLPILAVWSERQGWESEVVFSEPDNINYNQECDVVAMSLYTHIANEGSKIARKFRDLGKIVAMQQGVVRPASSTWALE